jgi:hypothetical protein
MSEKLFWEHPKFAKIVFSCGVGILPAWVFWAARVAYPTQMYLDNWDAPVIFDMLTH